MGKNIIEQMTDEDIKIIEASTNDDQPEEYSGPTWPAPLAHEAYYGLAGELVKAIAPHTEADPAALLFTLFVLFGNVIDIRSAPGE